MSGLAPTDNALSAADAKFLETLSQTKSFTLGRPTGVQMTRDGKTAVFLRALPRKAEQRLFAFELASGQTRELASNESVLGAGDEQLSPEEKARRERMRITARGIVQFELSEDGTLALFQLGGRAWVVPVAGGKAKEAAGPDAASHPIFDPHLSPDASMVSFVRGGELWVASLAGPMQKQLTSGSSTTLLHARAEYVAQEELSRFQGYWWSPDSKSLVYEEVDNSGVEQLWLQDPGAMFNAVTPMAYPRPGKANAKIRFGIVPAAGGETRWIDHDAKQWEYVSRVTWQPGGPLAMIVLTRDQKTLGLLAIDPNTGASRELLREHDDVFLNSERDLRFLADGRFLWSSEAEGRWQLHLHAADGKRERTLTPLELGFVHIAGLDEADGVVFVTASPTPVQGQLHEVKLDGSGLTRLHAGDEHVTAAFSRTRARVEHVLPAEGEPKSIAVRADGTIAGELPSVAEAPPFMPKLSVRVVGGMASSELAARDTTKSMLEFYTALIKPHDFDASKKYPTLVRVYGGPHRNEVHETAFNYLIDQWIADHGFLVLHVDGRGTLLRGRAWERAIFGKFAEVPLDDTVAALQGLARLEPAIDLARVGIIGHSFGGFLSALAVFKRPDVFKASVSGAPVVDWMNYDTAYTERYLGVPGPAGTTSKESYEQNGLLPYAKDLSRPLLLMHGTADDNVHFSETMLLADALFRAGKRFELIPFLHQTHQISARPELAARQWERVFAFFSQNL